MKHRIFLITTAALMSVTLLISAAGPGDTPQEKYIQKYAPVAVSEMYRSGVPASITLAQGLLESRYGLSELAVNGNNHFGIKCHDWTGKKIYHDDDHRQECFRAYKSPDESFSDHSDFLRYRDRYKSLFDNDITDYKAWAHGLKKAGYATDPAYPSKLIKLIEDYRLYEYDKMKPEAFAQNNSSRKPEKGKVNAGETSSPIVMPAALTKKQKRAERKATKHHTQEVTEVTDQIPESPHALEQPKKVSEKRASEIFSFSLSRQVYSNNGVPFIYSAEGESYGSIAHDYNLFVREILKFNDAPRDCSLAPGTVIYLKQKKNQAPKGLEKYISDDGGETMRDIAQRFGIRLKDLCKMNQLSEGHVTLPGDELDLRIVK